MLCITTQWRTQYFRTGVEVWGGGIHLPTWVWGGGCVVTLLVGRWLVFGRHARALWPNGAS